MLQFKSRLTIPYSVNVVPPRQGIVFQYQYVEAHHCGIHKMITREFHSPTIRCPVRMIGGLP